MYCIITVVYCLGDDVPAVNYFLVVDKHDMEVSNYLNWYTTISDMST